MKHAKKRIYLNICEIFSLASSNFRNKRFYLILGWRCDKMLYNYHELLEMSQILTKLYSRPGTDSDRPTFSNSRTRSSNESGPTSSRNTKPSSVRATTCTTAIPSTRWHRNLPTRITWSSPERRFSGPWPMQIRKRSGSCRVGSFSM